jgi:putative ABC transport system permease protein
MRWLKELLRSVRSIFRRGREEQQLSEELQFHLERQIEQNLAAGMAPEEARYAALRLFGGVQQIREECRDMRGVNLIENLIQDLRYGLRMLRANPGFTAVAVITLALGIGANTAIFSVADALLWKPLALPELDRLVMVMERQQKQPSGWIPVSPANYIDWKTQNKVFEHLAAWEYSSANLTRAGGYFGEPERLDSVLVSPDFFDTLELKPLIGRGFADGDDIPGRDQVVVLSQRLWRRSFAGDPGLVGKTVRLDGRDCTVIGVMPEGAGFPTETKLFMPLAMPDALRHSRVAHNLFPVARLKAGVSTAQANAEMAGIAQRIAQLNPHTNSGWTTTAFPLHEFLVGDLPSYMALLLGTVGFVLLIACANVANLQMARATRRSREMAVRTVLGASRGRLTRQLLVESVALATLGAALGMLFARWGVDALRSGLSAQFTSDIPGWAMMHIDHRAFAFTLSIAAVSGIVSGLAPALLLCRLHLNETLKEVGRTAAEGRRHSHIRGVLVATETALAMLLLVGAGLMVKGIVNLARSGEQLGPRKLLVMRVDLPNEKYQNGYRQADFFQQALEGLAALPGVQSTAVASVVPHTDIGTVSSGLRGITLEGKPVPAPGQRAFCVADSVSASYFRTLRIPLKLGREFSARDGPEAPRVAIISEEMWRQYWPGEDPVGKRLKFGDADSNEPWLSIVGVVGDVPMLASDEPMRPLLYLPYRQRPVSAMQFSIRTTGDPAGLISAARAQVQRVDREQPVYHVETLQRMIDDELLGLHYISLLMAIFGALAMMLAALGIYGVMSYTVSQRSHEIGVRIALGAASRDVLGFVVRRGLMMSAAGVATGLAAAFALAHLLTSLLHGVRATDFATYAGASLLLMAVAFAASYIPARRATKVDPMVALRYE